MQNEDFYEAEDYFRICTFIVVTKNVPKEAFQGNFLEGKNVENDIEA